MAKLNSKYKKGDEISFYYNKRVCNGIIHFIGQTFISVYPCNAYTVGDDAPMENKEHNVEIGDII